MRRLLVLALALGIALAGCGGSSEPEEQVRAGGPGRGLADLTLDSFRASFNADEGKPRLVLLLAPT